MSVCVSYTALLLRNISQLSDPNKTEYPTALYIYSLLSVKMFKDQKKNYACTHSKLRFHTKFDWASWFFFLLFFTFWSLIRLIWRQMCWISIVGVSSNIIILESSNYKIFSIFYYVYQTMWNTRQPKSAKFHF